MPPPANIFSLGFTALSLRPELARILAEAFTSQGTWGEAKTHVLSRNAFQSRSTTTAKRIECELRRRLSALTPRQIQLFAVGSMDCCASLAWLSVVKTTPFAFSFAAGLLRQKLEANDRCLRRSDYEDFFLDQSSLYPFLAALSASSKAKLRSVLLSMLRETTILIPIGREDSIQRPVIPAEVQSVILADDPHWLAGFLVPDPEIASLAN
jgi:hypothetical protein